MKNQRKKKENKGRTANPIICKKNYENFYVS